VIALSAVATAVLGVRTLNTFLVLRSAYAAGAPDLSSVRAWMTIRYVATTYRAPERALLERLGLPHGTDPDTTLKSLAERAGLSRVDYVQRVQRVLAEVAPSFPARTRLTPRACSAGPATRSSPRCSCTATPLSA
jgi:hypothetical protein